MSAMIGMLEWCAECECGIRVTDVHEEQIGYEEQARAVLVFDLACGHEIVSEED